MLVLSRKTNETICIGDDVEITVIAVRGKTVRLGLKCPEEIRILRRELKKEEGSVVDVPANDARMRRKLVRFDRKPAYVTLQRH